MMRLPLKWKDRTFYIGIIVLLLFILVLNFPLVLQGDRYLSLHIYNFFKNTFITNLFIFVTDYTLGYIVGPILISLFLFYKHEWKSAIFFWWSLLVLTITRFELSQIIHRPRPFAVDTNILHIANIHSNRSSFPSGDATQAFFIAYFITAHFKTNTVNTLIVYGLAILVLISRVYLGVHYVSDVLVGGMFGLVWGYASYSLFKKYLEIKVKRQNSKGKITTQK